MASTPKVIITNPKTGEQKEFPKQAWENLGKSTNGWEFVRNADDNDKQIPKNEIGKAKKDDSKYIPAEVKNLKEMKSQNAPHAQAEIKEPVNKISNPAGDPNDFKTAEAAKEPARNISENPNTSQEAEKSDVNKVAEKPAKEKIAPKAPAKSKPGPKPKSK